MHAPVSDVGGIRRGSVHAAVVGGLKWATASFLPAAVRAARGLATPAACGSGAKAVPKVTPHTETGTNASITTVTLSQVGRGDTPGQRQRIFCANIQIRQWLDKSVLELVIPCPTAILHCPFK